MVRLWIKCFLAIFCTLLVFYFYLSINVPDAGHRNILKALTKPDETNVGTTFDNDKPRDCSIVHIAVVCAGYNSTSTLVTTVKSIIFHRTKPLHLHILADEIARGSLTVLFNTWKLPQVRLSYYHTELWVPKVAWIPNRHYSGVYGLLKLVLPEALNVSKILVLDTDITVLNDVSILWNMFDEFDEKQAFGLVENQSEWYIKQPLFGVNTWPALGFGFNTGVMLMDLQRLRSLHFMKLWESTSKLVLQDALTTLLADQDIINAVIKENPELVMKIACTWNIQLSDHALSESCYNQAKQLNIIHWNSPRKQKVKNKHVKNFRMMHNIFLELDGNLLRRTLFGCSQDETTPINNLSNPCQQFTEGAAVVYRTHLFFLEFKYNIYSPVDVALVTQCSIDRIMLLEELSKHWTGIISVALYLTDTEVQIFLKFVRNSVVLRNRQNIAYHIVYKDGDIYPINYLRNVAMSHLSVSYIFQLDIDFLPQYGLYENLMNHIIQMNISESDKFAFIIPAFETQRYRFTFPMSKTELLKFLDRGIVYTFRYHVWARGHAATNYSLFRNSIKPYEVTWEPDFEPYLVVSRSAPEYDTRFIGFGWNKVSYVTHLAALGYRFFVLPDTFIIHRPHAPSKDIEKFRSDVMYRRCLKKLKDTFVDELFVKYGHSGSANLQKLLNKAEKKTPKSTNTS